MKILLTNDDGIRAPGLRALHHELNRFSAVTVIAPDRVRSSIGHAITLGKPLRVKKIRLPDGSRGYACSGTPADGIKLAVSPVLKIKPDLIVSGINLGPNDGLSIFYSGTVAAAREGALMGIPSIAFSVDSFTLKNFGPTARTAAQVLQSVWPWRLPSKTFLNVNIPAISRHRIKGIRLTRQGMDPIHGEFSRKKDPRRRDVYWMKAKAPIRGRDISLDTFALKKGYITITPLQSDLTDQRVLTKMRRQRS